MLIRNASAIALAGGLVLALSGSAFAQAGGGTELPSSAKNAQKAESMKGGAMKGDSMKGGAMKGGAMKSGGCGMMKK